MNSYEVFDYDFKHVGFVEALTPEAALDAAKKRWKFVTGLMVQHVATQ